MEVIAHTNQKNSKDISNGKGGHIVGGKRKMYANYNGKIPACTTLD